nr:hypothetical protein [Tanacetum cinerariifolium]
SSANNSVFRGFFKKQKLTGPNFIDWYQQLRIVLSINDKLNYLEEPIPLTLVAPKGQQVAHEIIAAHIAWIKGSKEIAGLMLMTMKPEIQRNLENLHAHEMLQELKTLFSCKLSRSFFKLREIFTLASRKKGSLLARHWKRNCPQYLSELLKKKKLSQGASNSGIFTIELNIFLNRSWIYDTDRGTHICNTTQGPRASRKLKSEALSLYVGNIQCEAVEAIGAIYLCLPGGLEIVLNNFHYAPSITRGVIYVSRLYEDGFINHFVNNTI